MKNHSGAGWIVLALVLATSIPSIAQESAILEAAQNGDLETVARLLKENPKLVQAKNSEGETVLHQASGCYRGEEAALSLVGLLLQHGAVVDARNAGNQTPLLYASYAGFGRVVELLISKGASILYQDANGRSPLHYAAREGRPQVVEILIKKGADPFLKDGQNQTPLSYAALRNKTAVVELMMRLVRIDPKSAEGTLILHSAAVQGNAKLVEDMLAQGADPGRPSPNGDTILISYLRGGLTGLALKSVAAGADVRAKDAAGRTALHIAVEKGLGEAVATLLENGADSSAADNGGRTPSDIARDWGHASLTALLKSKGAKPSPPNAYVLKSSAYEAAQPPAGAESAVIRYIGTDGFLIQAGSKSVLIDGLVSNPWGYTNTPALAFARMKAAQAPFERIDLLLFSHAHRDHFVPEMALEVLSAQPQSVLVGDRLVSNELGQAGPEAAQALGSRIHLIDLKIGERTTLTAAGIPLAVLGVNHGPADRPYLTLGYIMELGGFKIYHQGDIFPEANLPFLASIPWEEQKIDIAFFDPFFFQNEETRRIVLERIKPSVVILMHMRDDEPEGYYNRLKPGVPQVLVFREPMESKVFFKAKR